MMDDHDAPTVSDIEDVRRAAMRMDWVRSMDADRRDAAISMAYRDGLAALTVAALTGRRGG